MARRMLSEIILVPVGKVNSGIVEFLSLALAETFCVPCALRVMTLDLEAAFDPGRNQFHSTRLLAQLVSHASGEGVRLLGVTEVDLFIPILTFVFGEAQLGRGCALVSTCRLRQEFYGLPGDETLLYRRAEKEAIHELGHTLGLVHCPDSACVMRTSHRVEDIDLKGSLFCPECAAGAAVPVIP